jgi:hypothetical protein
MIARGKIKDGRHVVLDFYDLLIDPILQRILTLAAADTELRQKRRVVHPRPVRLKIE